MIDTIPEHTDANLKNEVLCADNIVRYTMRTFVDHDEAVRLSTIGKDFIDAGQAQYVLIDLRKSTEFSAPAGKIWIEFLNNDKIKKTALFGGNVFVRSFATFVVTTTGKKDIKFFNNDDEAIRWFKE